MDAYWASLRAFTYCGVCDLRTRRKAFLVNFSSTSVVPTQMRLVQHCYWFQSGLRHTRARRLQSVQRDREFVPVALRISSTPVVNERWSTSLGFVRSNFSVRTKYPGRVEINTTSVDRIRRETTLHRFAELSSSGDEFAAVTQMIPLFNAFITASIRFFVWSFWLIWEAWLRSVLMLIRSSSAASFVLLPATRRRRIFFSCEVSGRIGGNSSDCSALLTRFLAIWNISFVSCSAFFRLWMSRIMWMISRRSVCWSYVASSETLTQMRRPVTVLISISKLETSRPARMHSSTSQDWQHTRVRLSTWPFTSVAQAFPSALKAG